VLLVEFSPLLIFNFILDYFLKIHFSISELNHTINITNKKEAIYMRNMTVLTVQTYKGGMPF
jgi:hypothetical protein